MSNGKKRYLKRTNAVTFSSDDGTLTIRAANRPSKNLIKFMSNNPYNASNLSVEPECPECEEKEPNVPAQPYIHSEIEDSEG